MSRDVNGRPYFSQFSYYLKVRLPNPGMYLLLYHVLDSELGLVVQQAPIHRGASQKLFYIQLLLPHLSQSCDKPPYKFDLVLIATSQPRFDMVRKEFYTFLSPHMKKPNPKTIRFFWQYLK